MMHRFRVTIPADDGHPLVVASGLVFADGVTVLRWDDGSGAYGLYPNESVLATINTPDGRPVAIDWPDGDPREELTHARTHAEGHVHTH